MINFTRLKLFESLDIDFVLSRTKLIFRYQNFPLQSLNLRVQLVLNQLHHHSMWMWIWCYNSVHIFRFVISKVGCSKWTCIFESNSEAKGIRWRGLLSTLYSLGILWICSLQRIHTFVKGILFISQGNFRWMEIMDGVTSTNFI